MNPLCRLNLFSRSIFQQHTVTQTHTRAHAHPAAASLYLCRYINCLNLEFSCSKVHIPVLLAFLQNAIRGLLSVKIVFNLLTSCPAHHCPLPVSLRLQYYVCGPPLLWRAGACLSLPSLPAQEVLAFPGTTILPKRAFALGSLFPLKALTINIILNYLDLIYWESILNLKN